MGGERLMATLCEGCCHPMSELILRMVDGGLHLQAAIPCHILVRC